MHRTSLALALVVAAIPALAGAQSGTQAQQQQQDTTRRGTQGQGAQQGQAGGRNTRSSGGDVTDSRSANRSSARTSRNNYGLDQDQIRQLQQAINDRTECEAGTPDGVMGPRTRRALTCARRALEIESNDMGAVFTALELDFGQGEAGQAGQAGQSGQAGQGSAGQRGQRQGTTGQRGTMGNRGGRDSTMRDSTRRDSTQRDSTQQPPR